MGKTLQVVKRDGRVVPFDRARIERAIGRCLFEVLGDEVGPIQRNSWSDAIARHIEAEVESQDLPSPITVEEIQDWVERKLMEANLHSTAKAYILYRAEHARARDERPIPEDVKAAFAESKQYFAQPSQELVYYLNYARWSDEKGRRETWVETVDRAVDFLHELAGDRLHPGMYYDIRRGILNMEAMPSMRLLATAGEAARRDNTSIYNCHSRDTKFVTSEGVRSFEDFEDGDTITVLSHLGEWRSAKVRKYAEHEWLNAITFKRGSSEQRVYATGNHRWLLREGRETTDLEVGNGLVQAPAPISYWRYEDRTPLERLYWAYGFVYGDGTLVKNGKGEYAYSMVRLCGAKTRFRERFEELGFKTSQSASLGQDFMAYTGTYLKTLPDLQQDGVDLVRAFVVGYLDADANLGTATNPYCGIQASDPEAIKFVREVFPVVGAYVLSERDLTGQETNYGARGETVKFGLLTGRSDGANAYYYARDIKRGVRVADLWCLEVEEDHSFVLPSGIVTGNCSAMGVASIDAFVEALLISMAGCGVGFSVERRFVEQLPRIIRQKGGVKRGMMVEDSTIGWADALRTGLECWFSGEDIEFDLSLIRPAGAPLRTKGGRASGPEPLRLLLAQIRSRILARQGGVLNPLDAHDLMCFVGSAAVMGGHRRSAMISLFDYDDQEMLSCKDGDFERENSQRWNANNSAVWPAGGLDQLQFMNQFYEMVKSGNGEPGIFNRRVANDLRPERRQAYPFLTNPCSEILLRDTEFCNLSIAVARAEDTYETLAEKVRLAAIIGTIQSLATNFPYLRPDWKRNCEEERLLGVDITGHYDSPIARDPEAQRRLREVAVHTNRKVAAMLGINQSAAVTCVKPSGNSAQLLDVASGVHPRYAPYYIRRYRVGATSPLYKVLKDAGVPLSPENGQTVDDAVTWVASFPIKSPEGAITRNDISAVEHCEYWLQVRRNYTEHKPSATIYYGPDEVIDLMKWVWEHRDEVDGVTFLPRDDVNLDQLPYEEISRERYEQLAASFPEIDFSKIVRHEHVDMTIASQQAACSAGNCETI